ncbi:tRNA lysidine(34) synthetase TilS [Notoacmeibacter marinus]|uniref:tRNA lysidine(34) synthetase TilS n=1 Tax=Notoacmeibacter marinus TaxID=1876515 RepID=UPI000DF42412|nr:tRNA lysidine(34) synthetase TilS [Notoacmeibacter marinus]
MLTRSPSAEPCPDALAAATASFSFALPATGPLLLAVSGGGDSMAMLHLVHRALIATGETARLSVATVDHGLRAGSADEALFVAETCHMLALPHRTLRWSGAKPQTGLQAAARHARYRLLSDLAAPLNATILIAHTADDQNETVAMRARRDPSSRLGLSGMADAIYWRAGSGGAWVWRPFLGESGRSLRQWLDASGLNYLNDPSNGDRRFERIRLRQDQDITVAEEKPGDAERHGETRRMLDRAVGSFIADHVDWAAPQTLAVRHEYAADEAYEVGVEALRVVLAFAGQIEYRPSGPATHAMLRQLSKSRRASLARCVIERSDEGLLIRREHRRQYAARVVQDPASAPADYAPHPFESAVPVHDLATARQIERLCRTPPTPEPPQLFLHDIGD